jgi:hypothetical protein
LSITDLGKGIAAKIWRIATLCFVCSLVRGRKVFTPLASTELQVRHKFQQIPATTRA